MFMPCPMCREVDALGNGLASRADRRFWSKLGLTDSVPVDL